MKSIKILVFLLTMSCSLQSSAQVFWCGVESYTTNFWASSIGQVIKALTLGHFSCSYAYSIPVSNDAPQGFGDMYNGYSRAFSNPFKRLGDCGIGLSCSGFIEEMPLGLYGSLMWKSSEVHYKNMDKDSNDRAGYLSPEFGVRLRTANNDDNSFYFSLGAAYDIALKYKGRVHDYDKKAINSGFCISAGLGWYNIDDIGFSLSIKYIQPLYNFYDKKYSPDNGITLPFSQVERKVGYIMCTLIRAY